ncbi:hypothetical protein [Arthrobacter sp. Br18]|nr:hypothetical protein [Arthrobacter sp. Br18]
MKKIIGAAAGLLILVGTAGGATSGPSADDPGRYSGSISASSWDWPK